MVTFNTDPKDFNDSCGNNHIYNIENSKQRLNSGSDRYY